MLYADDAALLSHSANGLEYLIDSFAVTCEEYSLVINSRKTLVMQQLNDTSDEIVMKENILDGDSLVRLQPSSEDYPPVRGIIAT